MISSQRCTLSHQCELGDSCSNGWVMSVPSWHCLVAFHKIHQSHPRERFHWYFKVYLYSLLRPGCLWQCRNWPGVFLFEIFLLSTLCLMVSFSELCVLEIAQKGWGCKSLYFFPFDSEMIEDNRHKGEKDLPYPLRSPPLPRREKCVGHK